MHNKPYKSDPRMMDDAQTMWKHFTLAIKISIPVAAILTVLGIAFLG